MLFLGMTYDVFREDVPIEQEPYVYARVQSSIVGPGDAIRLPDPGAHVLYEGELVVVIGSPMYPRAGRRCDEPRLRLHPG